MRSLVILFAALALGCPIPAVAAEPESALNINKTFRDLYASARTQVRQQQTPVIVSLLGNLTYLYKDKRETVPLIGDEWQMLKVVDHVPLAIYVGLQAHTDAPLDASVIADLTKLYQQIGPLGSDVSAATFTVGNRARQQLILTGSAKFLDGVIRSRCVSAGELTAFARLMGKLVLANADEAEELEMSAVDRAVCKWRGETPAADWRELRVVICDGHMPRDQERIWQYFAALLRERREGQRIVFMENGDDEGKALDLLATHILDERIAVGFFDDPWRMHRDFLSDGARHYLRKHPPLSSDHCAPVAKRVPVGAR